MLVATIFLGIVLSESYRLAYNTEILAVPSAVANAPLFLGDVVITREQIWVSLGALACGLSGFLLFRYARTGRSMRAMASNVRGAQLCGYSVDGVYALAWFFGGVLAGLAGVFTAPSTGVSPELAVSTVTAAFVAAAIGGFDSVGGALLGGLILGIAGDTRGRLRVECGEERHQLPPSICGAVVEAGRVVSGAEGPQCLTAAVGR